MKSNKSIIKLENVWKIYSMGEVEIAALKGIDVNIDQGEFVSIVGASGSGKSTMMHLVGCLDLPTKGAIYLDNRNISLMPESELSQVRGKRIGFIFQQFNLLHDLTAIENVMLPMEFQDSSTIDARKKATELLNLVGLGDRLNHRPSQLSGGEQQRVAIARALSNDPDIILADEPTGNLDTRAGSEVMNLLEKLWKQGKTIIIVTHDMKLAEHSKRKIQLKDGELLDGR